MASLFSDDILTRVNARRAIRSGHLAHLVLWDTRADLWEGRRYRWDMKVAVEEERPRISVERALQPSGQGKVRLFRAIEEVDHVP